MSTPDESWLTDAEIEYIRQHSSDDDPADWSNLTVRRLIVTIDNLNALLVEEQAGEDI
jgi:hypothetical protein